LSNIAVKNISKAIKTEIKQPVLNDFISMHIATESYFRRLLYIGLRLEGKNDDNSKLIINWCSLNINEILKISIDKIGKTKQMRNNYFEELCSNSVSIKWLHKYHEQFTTKYRNLIFHGIVDNLTDELISNLYKLDRKLLIELENEFKTTFNCSCLDTPTKWGAVRVMKNLTKNEVWRYARDSGLLGKRTNKPLEWNSVKKTLKKFNIEI